MDGLKECNGGKAPGPNGFNVKSLQEFWHVVKRDVVEVFDYLHDFNPFMKLLNSTFFVLVAKVKGIKKHDGF